jgi:hypothetical protein
MLITQFTTRCLTFFQNIKYKYKPFFQLFCILGTHNIQRTYYIKIAVKPQRPTITSHGHALQNYIKPSNICNKAEFVCFVLWNYSLLLEAVTFFNAPWALFERSHTLCCKTLEALSPRCIMWRVIPQRSATNVCPCWEHILQYTAPVLALYQLASLLQHTFLPTRHLQL